MSQRLDRIDELLRQEIGELLAREVADPGIGFVTVTGVETSPDLAHARVRVSVIGQRPERTATLQALRRAMPYIRHLLGERVRLRRIPDLHVELDETAERGTRVLQLLHELEEGRTPEESPLPGESLPTPSARIDPQGSTQEPPAWSPSSGRGRPRPGDAPVRTERQGAKPAGSKRGSPKTEGSKARRPRTDRP